jgi:hypothetical protein
MDYLTTYYKNLCNQLEEKRNILQLQLNEGRYNPETGEIDLVRGDMWHPSDEEYAEYHRNRNAEIEKAGGYKNWAAAKKKENQERSRNFDAGKIFKPQSNPRGYVKPNPDNLPKIKPNLDKDYFNPYKTESEKLGTEWAPKPWLNNDNIKVPDSFFKEKRKSPNLNIYGDPDAIDIMPEPRKDLVSSVNKEPRPAFNNNLNLLRDKTLSDSRNTIDFNEIKNKLSRVAKNI